MTYSTEVDPNRVLHDKRQAQAKGMSWVMDGATHAVVFAKGSYAIGFSGKKEKPDFAGDFVTEEIRKKAVASWIDAQKRKKHR
jgi:hypothetical protein